MNDAATAPTPVEKLTTQQQNDLSAHAAALNFLNDVSGALNPKHQAWPGYPNAPQYDAENYSSDAAAHNDLKVLQNDPLYKQFLNQVATDMSDPATMAKLGLTGSVLRDKNGDVSSIAFTNSGMSDVYNSGLQAKEAGGESPTRAAADLAAVNPLKDTAEQGTITFNVNDTMDIAKPAPPPAPQDGYSGTGISVNGIPQ
jgi:hypothetical protein